MKIPSYLKPGSKIRIVSPAGKIEEKDVLPAVKWLTEQGFEVELGKHVFANHFQFAGTDSERLEDMQIALDDPDTDAILCSRGGYGTVRIINSLDFSRFLQNPKWLVGFSDITVLHSCLHNRGVATLHGVMPRYFFNESGEMNESLESMINLLTGKEVEYVIPANKSNRTGRISGELTGGNFSIISSLQGTKCELDTSGKILLLEDLEEFLYHTDRMTHQLKLAGKLDNLAALVIGDFTDMKDNESPFGKTVQEILSEAVAEFDYPVCFGFPAGHDKKNLALTFGQTWDLSVTENNSILTLTL